MDHHLIACPVLAQELRAILKTNPDPPIIHLMDYSIHINAQIMEDELQKQIQPLTESLNKIGIVVGKSCKARTPITTIAKQHQASLPLEQNCIEMILGRERTQELQQNRTAIMTPGWIDMMNNSIADGNWRAEDARINMGWYDKILLLDTGTVNLDDETIMAFFELTEVPIEVMKVDLCHFKQVVTKLLSKKT